MCVVNVASNEESIDILSWTFVSEDGNSDRLNDRTSGGKYTITQTNVGSSVRSKLVVNNLENSDEGSYYCQAEFSNGTALPRSQEISVFDSRAYMSFLPCNESRIESAATSRCILFTSEVVQPLPSAQPSVTTVTALSVTTTSGSTGNGNVTQNIPSTMTEQGESEEGDLSISNILLYTAIGAVVFLVIVVTLLVVCICLCNRACDCCTMCS